MFHTFQTFSQKTQSLFYNHKFFSKKTWNKWSCYPYSCLHLHVVYNRQLNYHACSLEVDEMHAGKCRKSNWSIYFMFILVGTSTAWTNATQQSFYNLCLSSYTIRRHLTAPDHTQLNIWCLTGKLKTSFFCTLLLAYWSLIYLHDSCYLEFVCSWCNAQTSHFG